MAEAMKGEGGHSVKKTRPTWSYSKSAHNERVSSILQRDNWAPLEGRVVLLFFVVESELFFSVFMVGLAEPDTAYAAPAPGAAAATTAGDTAAVVVAAVEGALVARVDVGRAPRAVVGGTVSRVEAALGLRRRVAWDTGGVRGGVPVRGHTRPPRNCVGVRDRGAWSCLTRGGGSGLRGLDAPRDRRARMTHARVLAPIPAKVALAILGLATPLEIGLVNHGRLVITLLLLPPRLSSVSFSFPPPASLSTSSFASA